MTVQGALFWDHVIYATLPVVKICLLGSVGAGLARAGILDQAGRRALSKLVYVLFTPALTFAKLAPVLSGPHLLLWMPIAINMFMSVGAGLLLGVLLVVVLRPPAALRRHVVVACGLGNAGNLPLVLVTALIKESAGQLFKGEAISEDLGIAYVAVGIWAATLTHFTIGTQLLKLPADQQQQEGEGEGASLQLITAGAAHDSSSARHSKEPPSYAAVQAADGKTVQTALAAAGGGLAACGDVGAAVHGGTCFGSVDGSHACCTVELGTMLAPGRYGQGVAQQQQQQQQQQQEAGLQRQHPVLSRGGASCSTDSLRSSSSSSSCADCVVLASGTPTAAMTGGSGSSWLPCHTCGAAAPDSGRSAVSAAAARGGGGGSGTWQCPGCSSWNDCRTAGLAGKGPAQIQQQQQHDIAACNENACLLGPQHQLSSINAGWPQRQHRKGWIKGWFGRASSSGGSSTNSGSNGRRQRLRAVGQVAWELAQQQVSPPMVGCVLAVVVGVIPALRDQLFAPDGHLLMLQDCINMFSACCIPCLLLMLGATLARGPGSAKVPPMVVLGVGAARLVLLPLLGTGWVVLAKAAGWMAPPDKMFVMIMLIQNAVPTALNVHTLATMHGNREEEMAAMLFWQYLAACITMPAFLSFYLWLLGTPVMAV